MEKKKKHGPVYRTVMTILLAATAGVLIWLFFRLNPLKSLGIGGGKGGIEAPVDYIVGAECVKAFAPPEDTKVAYLKKTHPPETTPSTAEEYLAIEPFGYRYSKMEETDAPAKYAEFLTTEAEFVPVVEGVAAELPELTGEQWSVTLCRPISLKTEKSNSDETPVLLNFELARTEKEYTVTISCIEGSIDKGQGGDADGDGLTLEEALEYVNSLHPSVLELEGDTMMEYRAYALDGAAMVNGSSCLRINIYYLGEIIPTNKLAGQYFISGDGQRLYRITDIGKVKELV